MTGDRGQELRNTEAGTPGRSPSPVTYPLSPVPWLATVRSVVALVENSDVREMELRTGGLRIMLRRSQARSWANLATVAETEGAETSGLHVIRSPLTGIWYDAPAPDAAPFVRVGDVVDVGSIVGLVETMKVFNEVTADAYGLVRQIFVRRGDLIATHAPLMSLEPAAPPVAPGEVA